RVRFDKGDVLLKKVTFKRPAKELLHQLETDDDVTGRIEAAEALAEMAGKLAGGERDDARARLAAARSGDKFHAVRSAAARALAKLGKEAIPALLEGLGDSHPKARRAAVEALGEAAKGADEKEKGRTASKLAALFDSEPSPHARAAALRALAALGTDEAPRVLLAALAVPSHREMIRGAAVEGLAEMKHPNALELATNLSRYGNPSRLRGAALSALEKLGKGNKRVLEHLIGLTRDPFIWTREKAYEVLGSLGAPEAIPVLRERIEKEFDARLQEAARKALVQVEEAAASKLSPEAALEAKAKRMELEAREKELRAKKDLLDAEILAREAEKLRAEAELSKIQKEREAIEEKLKKAGAAAGTASGG
ncbi:MAG: HEAT repeat domain-containing protein, partial [Planctomycetales bacterium]|nr:HEAT repeat domain-containing protein [Planctomycetales bacterium]